MQKVLKIVIVLASIAVAAQVVAKATAPDGCFWYDSDDRCLFTGLKPAGINTPSNR